MVRFLAMLMSLSLFQALAADWHTDVIGMDQAKLSADYWLAKLDDGNKVLMSQAEIQAFNAGIVKRNPNVIDPLAFPARLSKAMLLHELRSISHIPKSARFNAKGKQLTKADFQQFENNLNLPAIKGMNPVQFGLVVRRARLRTYPTDQRIFNRHMDLDLDRFEEAGLFPADPVAVLHRSTDGKWLLVRNYHYLAWVKADAIALGDVKKIRQFATAKPFVLVTGDKVFTNYTRELPAASEVQLDMGVRLPLLTGNQLPNVINGQNSYASYAVRLPIRDKNGQLHIVNATIPRHADMHIGYLPYTKANIIKQAFKFLGERYGWGHDFNSRDCTGFVGEVYKSFGFHLPRNSGQQGNASYGINHRFTSSSTEGDRMAVINTLQTGDLVYIPGHVMMMLGTDKGQPYVIHDVKGLGYLKPDGNMYHGALNGVSVTPLLPLRLSSKTRYIDRSYNIKRMRPGSTTSK